MKNPTCDAASRENSLTTYYNYYFSCSQVQGRSDGGVSVYIPSQNQSLKIILCTNCSRCRQAASI